jgi:predicted nucleotidyltransferase
MIESEIREKLDGIEREHDVSILLACESGSRAWGFASPDSDYDVRFIYAHQRDWYLSVFEERDVIELPVSEVLDINGWDIKKALLLLRKSNPPLLEWLVSPIRYRCNDRLIASVLDLREEAFLPLSSCHHYLSMAKKAFLSMGDSADAPMKKYLYALRAVLCCQWIIKHGTQPPMLIDELLQDLLNDKKNAEILDSVNMLILQKRESTEKDTIERSALLDDYIADSIETLSEDLPENPPRANVQKLNNVFRAIIEQV